MPPTLPTAINAGDTGHIGHHDLIHAQINRALDATPVGAVGVDFQVATIVARDAIADQVIGSYCWVTDIDRIYRWDGAWKNLDGLYNIYDHGALGGDAGDDSAFIQDAIDTAEAAGGGTVIIPIDTFICSNVKPKTNVSIRGLNNGGSILKQKAGTVLGPISASYLLAQADNVTVSDIQVDGNKANTTAGTGIQFSGLNVVVERCYVHDTAEGSISLGRPSGAGKVRIQNNWCHNPAEPGNFWGAISATGGAGITISNNIVSTDETDMAYAIDIEPNPGWVASDVIIANNVCQSAIVVSAGTGTITNAAVTGNTVDVNPSFGGSPAGIRVDGVAGLVEIIGNSVDGPTNTSPAIYAKDVTDPVIVGNRAKINTAAQNTYPNAVCILLEDVAGGYVASNYCHSGSATHGTEIAGIKETGTTANVVYGINGFRNITVHGQDSATVSGTLNATTVSATTLSAATAINVNGNQLSDNQRNILVTSIKDAASTRAWISPFANELRISGAGTTGLKLASGGTGDKMGFWGVTPVVQQVLATGAAHTVDDVIAFLQTVGMCKQS